MVQFFACCVGQGQRSELLVKLAVNAMENLVRVRLADGRKMRLLCGTGIKG